MLETIVVVAQFLWNLDFSKMVTVIVAAFATYIGYRQYRLGRERFKLDLFEKRFAVFESSRRLLGVIMRDANLKSLDSFFEFRNSVVEAPFLFDDDITDYLDTLGKKAVRLHTLHQTMEPLPVGERRSNVAKEMEDLLHWFNDQFPELQRRFDRYLKFGTWI